MKRPSFQFYPGDWRTNANLRRCSPAARGVWMDVMCLFHDSDEYGCLRWPLRDIAQSAGASIAHIKELVDKGVLRGSDTLITDELIYTPRHGRKEGAPVTLIGTQDGPLWYSSRMVKDEYVRTIRGESSRFGASNGTSPEVAPKDAPKPPFGDGSSSSSSSSPSGKEEEAPPAKPPARRRKPEIPWPDGFELSADMRAYAEQHLPAVDAPGLFEQFHDQALAKAWQYADWLRAWQMYVRNAAPDSGHFAANQYPRRKTGNEPLMFGGEPVKWQ